MKRRGPSWPRVAEIPSVRVALRGGGGGFTEQGRSPAIQFSEAAEKCPVDAVH